MHLRAVCAVFGMTIVLFHCDNGATGVDACRQIEAKRCEAAMGCPGVAITNATEVTNCQLFYRDQCEFGLADAVTPDAIQVESCLAAIGAARSCQDAAAAGDTTGLASCSDAPILAANVAPASSGCEVILAPEKLQDCAFLAPAAAGDGGGSASESGSGGGTGGASEGGGGAAATTDGAGGSGGA